MLPKELPLPPYTAMMEWPPLFLNPTVAVGRRRRDQVRLKLIAVADAVVPPGCVGVPDTQVLVGELREFRLGLDVIHSECRIVILSFGTSD